MALSKEELRNKFLWNSKSALFNSAISDCELVARSHANVLLIGESGTGKDIAAQYIHACSKRKNGPFVAVNCSAYPSSLLESELFGYTKGAFTGADKNRVGKFESSDKGTIFLDEIGDISYTTQVKLLRTIETKTIEPLGSDKYKNLDFRLITATNKDLHECTRQGHFREDFLYRISTVVIKMPSIKDRPEDMDDLIEYFIEKAQQEYSIPIHAREPETMKFLKEYDYPGNIREMKNLTERMVILSEDGVMTKRGLPILYGFGKNKADLEDEKTDLIPWEEFKVKSESKYLKYVLNYCKWNVTRASEILGITTRSIYNKIAEYKLKE